MTRLTATQVAEVERWLPLANNMAHSRARRYLARFEPGDVRAWAALGLIDAVQKFDPNWSTPDTRDLFFSVFARARIAGAIVDGFRRESTLQRVHRGGDSHIYLNPPIGEYDPTLDDHGHDGGVSLVDDRHEARAVVDAVLRELEQPASPQHPRRVEPADVLRLLIRGVPARRIAELCGVDESRISQIVRHKIRPRIAELLAT